MLKKTAEKVESITLAILAFFGIIALVVGISLLMGFPVMWLWNWLMPPIFGLVKITFWQSVGLMMLSRFLIKGFAFKSK